MKIVIVCRSDRRGGAAIVSFRLMKALRNMGVDARMLVAEKLTDSPYVETAASSWRLKKEFLRERLDIFLKNGFNRATLFKIDTGQAGLPLWRHHLVKEADAIILNWVNQGMLSISGVKKMLQLGKPVVWTMHDLWNFTGICHHPYDCTRYREKCGDCPLLGKEKTPFDLSYKIWNQKNGLYESEAAKNLQFVAVSTWLKEKARTSSLLGSREICVIPNAVPLVTKKPIKKPVPEYKVTLLFGAARLDDPIKGLPVLIESTKVLKRDYPEVANKFQLNTFGNIKNPIMLNGFAIPHVHLGEIKGEEAIAEIYSKSDIVISASSWETLPTTLVEAQLYGSLPVSFNRGGQSDIIDNGRNGFLALWDDNITVAAKNLADKIVAAYKRLLQSDHDDYIMELSRSAIDRFSPESVAQKYINLFNK